MHEIILVAWLVQKNTYLSQVTRKKKNEEEENENGNEQETRHCVKTIENYIHIQNEAKYVLLADQQMENISSFFLSISVFSHSPPYT